MTTTLTNQQLLKRFEKEGQTYYSKNSMVNYLVDVYHFINYLEERSILTQTTTDISNYLQHLATLKNEEGNPTYKQSTLNRNRASLVAFYNFIKSEGLLDHNPVTDLKSVTIHRRGEDTNIDYLNKQEMRQLLEEIKNEKYLKKDMFSPFNQARDLVLYHLMLTTGIRMNEVATLTFDQVDRKNHLIHVIDKDGQQRTIPYPTSLDEEMDEYLEIREDLGLESSLFFITKKGTPISIQNSNAALKKYGDAISLGRKISNGVLRHTYAVNMFKIGAPLEKISTYLGNKSPYYTSIIYQEFLSPTPHTYAEQIDL